MLEVGGLRQEEKVKNKRQKAEGRGTIDEGREKTVNRRMDLK
jgi:hypothetical protein